MIVDHLEFGVDIVVKVANTAIISVKGSDAGVVLGRRVGWVGITFEDDSVGKVFVRKRRINSSVRITIARLVQSDIAGPLDPIRILVVLGAKLAIAELSRNLRAALPRLHVGVGEIAMGVVHEGVAKVAQALAEVVRPEAELIVATISVEVWVVVELA